MKNLINLLIFVIMILMISCESKEQKQAKVETKINLSYEEGIKSLCKKYNAIRVSKPINSFTYLIQEDFIDNKKLICFEGKLEDITKTDSSFILKVSIDELGDTSYLALINVNYIKFKEIRNILKSNNHSKEGCFIFKVSKIYTFKPVIKNEDIPGPEDTDGETIMTFDFDNSLLIFKGELIDFYFKEM